MNKFILIIIFLVPALAFAGINTTAGEAFGGLTIQNNTLQAHNLKIRNLHINPDGEYLTLPGYANDAVSIAPGGYLRITDINFLYRALNLDLPTVKSSSLNKALIYKKFIEVTFDGHDIDIYYDKNLKKYVIYGSDWCADINGQDHWNRSFITGTLRYDGPTPLNTTRSTILPAVSPVIGKNSWISIEDNRLHRVWGIGYIENIVRGHALIALAMPAKTTITCYYPVLKSFAVNDGRSFYSIPLEKFQISLAAEQDYSRYNLLVRQAGRIPVLKITDLATYLSYLNNVVIIAFNVEFGVALLKGGLGYIIDFTKIATSLCKYAEEEGTPLAKTLHKLYLSKPFGELLKPSMSKELLEETLTTKSLDPPAKKVLIAFVKFTVGQAKLLVPTIILQKLAEERCF